MKREKLVDLFKVKRHNEGGVVSFSIDCPFGDCTNSQESFVHYGDEGEAENSAISKMILHCEKEHDEAIKNLPDVA